MAEKDRSLVELFAAQEFYVDGFTDHEVRDGILTCTAYRIQHGHPVVVFRVVIRAGSALASIDQAMAALKGEDFIQAASSVKMESGIH